MKKFVLLFTACFFAVTHSAFSQSDKNLVNSPQIHIQDVPWFPGKPHGVNAHYGRSIKYNLKTDRWDYVGNPVWRSFQTIVEDGGNLHFLSDQTWNLANSFPNSMTTQELLTDHTKMTITHQGNIGIGTSKPTDGLHLYKKNIVLDKGYILMDMQGMNAANRNKLMFHQTGILGESEVGFKFSWRNDDLSPRRAVLQFAPNGNVYFTDSYVQIGGVSSNYSHDGYRLSVNGKIRAQEVKIYTGWADYVFEEDYNLLSLEETESFIQENKHLPGIPSQCEIEENEGVNIGEMQKLQMAKIEELTLYMIELKKEVDAL